MVSDVYAKVSNRIETDWYPYHQAERFTQRDICDFFSWKELDTKQAVSRKLYHDTTELKEPKLEKVGKTYRIIDKDVDELDWVGADADNVINLKLPYGLQDDTGFDFEKNVLIPPKSLILIAGTSNEGKTAFCLNILVNNMDNMKTTYYTNEMSAVGFKRRMLHFDWCDLYNDDGKPKWRTVVRYDNYQDIIDPDGLNIIDYLDANEAGEYYKIAPYLKGIHKRLRNGLVVVALQKPPGRVDAFGGTNLRGVAALYLSIDKGKLEVVKAKDWIVENPNGRKYSFDITYSGSQFHNIHGIYEGEE